MKRVAIFVILAALTVGFSSCSAVRHCQAPGGDARADRFGLYRFADHRRSGGGSFTGIRRCAGSSSLTLENNKDMLAAAARVEQMRQLYRISKAERLPNFSAKGLADYETNDYADEESSRDRSSVPGSPSVGRIWTFGNLRWAKRKGGAEYLFGRGLACDAYDSRRGSCDGLFSVDGFG